MDDVTLIDVRKKAERVGEAHRSFQTELAQEKAAQAEFLEALVLAIKPALSAICSPISSWAHERRGLLVLKGPCLYLMEDGVFATALKEGNAFKITGPVLAEEVVEQWRMRGLETILDVLQRALDGQLRGRKGKQEDFARQSAEKLRAITLLLGAQAS